MTIRIRTQEFVRNGRHLYRVTNVKGVLPKGKLDPQYVASMPSFWLTETGKTIKLYDGTTLSINGVYRKSVFARILRMISKAGDRLHAMNLAKHRENANRQLQAQATANDVVVNEKTFKI
jgi:hypothetical protein